MTIHQNQPSEPNPEEELRDQEAETENQEKKSIPLHKIWNKVLHFGLGESVLRISTAIASIILIALVVWVMSKFFLKAEKNTSTPTIPAEEASATSIMPASDDVDFILASSISVFRLAQLHTIIPAKPRTEVTDYVIQQGDTIFDLATRFGLKPESLLWSNRHILGDDPHNIYPGVAILIPPFDGAIYQWHTGDGLNGVSSYYHVTPDAIVDFAGNHLNRETLGEYSLPNIAEGTLLFIPNGYAEFVDWLQIQYTRDTPATSMVGGGSCGTITFGAIGNNTYVWPVDGPWLSGYDYSPSTNHRGIDLGGSIGLPIYAVDGGVVVYSDWNQNGYGNLIVIDHGTGFQSIYAHLDSFLVYCGENVAQGQQIGTMGTTGNSSGPHLHFEIRSLEYGAVNPWDLLP